MKFTILFSRNNPDHVFAAEKLNQQGRNSKANYVAQAIKFFEEDSGFDKRKIERAIMDIMQGMGNTSFCTNNEDCDSIDKRIRDDINNSLDIFKRKR